MGTRTERASWRLCVVHEVAATTLFTDLSIGWLGYSAQQHAKKKYCNFPLSFTRHQTHCSSDLTVVPDLPKSTTDRLHKKSKKSLSSWGKVKEKLFGGKKSFFLNVKACNLHTDTVLTPIFYLISPEDPIHLGVSTYPHFQFHREWKGVQARSWASSPKDCTVNTSLVLCSTWGCWVPLTTALTMWTAFSKCIYFF